MSSTRKQKRKRTGENSEIPSFPSSTEGILMSFRDDPRPPAYTFKIQNFSLLSSLKLDNYESGVFSADGYKWKLSFYPNGNTKGDGEGHISLYLVVADTNDIPCFAEVKVTFKLFIYDFIRSKYLTIQDWRVRCFSKLRTEWGFDRLMSKEDFNDPSNRFISDYDSCTFGAEVIVVKPHREDCFEMIKNPTNGFFIWELANFSAIGDKGFKSNDFDVAGRKWRIVMYLNYSKGLSLSLYLKLDYYSSIFRSERDFHEQNIYVKFKLRMRDQVHGNHHEIEDDGVFSSNISLKGHYNFLTLEDLKDPSKGLLINDMVIVEAEILTISVLKVSEF